MAKGGRSSDGLFSQNQQFDTRTEYFAYLRFHRRVVAMNDDDNDTDTATALTPRYFRSFFSLLSFAYSTAKYSVVEMRL